MTEQFWYTFYGVLPFFILSVTVIIWIITDKNNPQFDTKFSFFSKMNRNYTRNAEEYAQQKVDEK